MPATLTFRDETATGDVVHTSTLEFLSEEITVRELITRRVQEEVREYNRTCPAVFQGLVRPPDAETALNPARPAPREISWERQRDAALAAFQANGFFILVGDRQVESLDERIRVDLGTEVSFVRLVPLVGG